MADQFGKCVSPPYKCNHCGEPLHGRYGMAVYTDNMGNHYCCRYCLKVANMANNGHFDGKDAPNLREISIASL